MKREKSLAPALHLSHKNRTSPVSICNRFIVAGGDKIPAEADKLNQAGSASPGVGKLFRRWRYLDSIWVWVSFIAPCVFGFIRMFRKIIRGKIYCLEARMKIASMMEEAKSLEEKADRYVDASEAEERHQK